MLAVFLLVLQGLGINRLAGIPYPSGARPPTSWARRAPFSNPDAMRSSSLVRFDCRSGIGTYSSANPERRRIFSPD